MNYERWREVQVRMMSRLMQSFILVSSSELRWGKRWYERQGVKIVTQDDGQSFMCLEGEPLFPMLTPFERIMSKETFKGRPM